MKNRYRSFMHISRSSRIITALWSCILFFSGFCLCGEPVVKNEQRLDQLLERWRNPDRTPSSETVVISEKELNDYIAYSLEKNKQPGLRKLIMELKPKDTFYARAFVNGDEMKINTEGIAGRVLRSMLQGDQLLEADGHIEMIGTKLKYDVDGIRLNGMSIPSGLTKELAVYLLKDKMSQASFVPLELSSYGISRVKIEEDSLTVEQR